MRVLALAAAGRRSGAGALRSGGQRAAAKLRGARPAHCRRTLRRCRPSMREMRLFWSSRMRRWRQREPSSSMRSMPWACSAISCSVIRLRSLCSARRRSRSAVMRAIGCRSKRLAGGPTAATTDDRVSTVHAVLSAVSASTGSYNRRTLASPGLSQMLAPPFPTAPSTQLSIVAPLLNPARLAKPRAQNRSLSGRGDGVVRLACATARLRGLAPSGWSSGSPGTPPAGRPQLPTRAAELGLWAAPPA